MLLSPAIDLELAERACARPESRSVVIATWSPFDNDEHRSSAATGQAIAMRP